MLNIGAERSDISCPGGSSGLETCTDRAARQAEPERAEPKRAGLTNRQNGTGRAFSSNRLGFICNISKQANFVAVGPAASIVDILPVSPTVEAPSKNRHL